MRIGKANAQNVYDSVSGIFPAMEAAFTALITAAPARISREYRFVKSAIAAMQRYEARKLNMSV